MEQIKESLSVVLIPPWKDETALIVWSVYLAVVAVWVYTLVHRGTVGRNLAALKKGGCTSPETAKPASALPGFREKSVSSYDRLIVRIGEEGTADRYFLPPDREEKAKGLMKGGETKLWKAILGLLGCYILMVLAYYFAPPLLNLFDKLNPF